MKLHTLFYLTIIHFLLFLFVQSLSASANNEQQQLDLLLEKVRKSASEVQSFSCNFTQKKQLSLFPEPVIFNGNLKLVRPDRLRWAFVTPIPSVLIFNGNKGLRCTENQKPVHFDLKTDPIMKIVSEQIWGWLNNDYKSLEKTYSIEKIGNSALRITPTDKSTSEYIGSVTIMFGEKRYHPKKVVITEEGGDSTQIEFTDYQFNTPVSQTMFTRCYHSE